MRNFTNVRGSVVASVSGHLLLLLFAQFGLPNVFTPPEVSVVIIGLITFVLSYAGVFIGKRFGHFFENKIEAAGGLVLVGLGVKILFEHLLLQ